LSKILKGNEIKGISVFVPEIPKVGESEFKQLMSSQTPEGEGKDLQKKESVNLEALKAQAKEEGFNAGYEEGFKKGVSDGKKEGYQKGFEEGYQEGLKKAEKEKKDYLASLEAEYEKKKTELEAHYQKKLEELTTLLQAIKDSFEKTVLELDEEVLKIALNIAKVMIFKEVEANPEVTLGVIREALRYIAEGSKLSLRVNPKEFEHIKDALRFENKKGCKLELIPDEGISPGGVFIESEFGVIDATFETRWKKLLEALGKSEG